MDYDLMRFVRVGEETRTFNSMKSEQHERGFLLSYTRVPLDVGPMGGMD